MELVLESQLKIGKVPDYQNKKFGKLQISSQKLAPYIGQIVKVKMTIEI